MKKILAGFIMDGHGGGVDNYLLNFLENIASEDVTIDFLTNEIDKELEGFLGKYHSRLFAIANLILAEMLKRPKTGIVKLNEKGRVFEGNGTE